MSISAVSSSTQLSAMQSNFQQLRKQFTQLGQDLSAGNLTQAQTDFVTLSQAASAQFGSNGAITQTLNTVGQALQSGDLSAAQQAFSTLPVGFVGPNAVSNHPHRHHTQSAFSQQLGQLGQALQSGNLTAAQQAFAALQQNWSQSAQGSGASSNPKTLGPTAVSITA